MTRRLMFLATLLLLGAAPASMAARAADILKAVPDGALAVTIVNRLAETDGKIQATAKRLQTPVPGMLDTLKVAAGVQEGVDEKGSAALVIMPPDAEEPGAQPVVLLLLPVTDFGKFIAQLSPEDATAKLVKVQIFGGPYLATKRGDYALLGDVDQKELLTKIVASKKTAAADLEPLGEWIGENDITGVVTPKGVQYFTNIALTELRKAKAQMADMPDEAKEMMGSMSAVFEFYEKVLEGVSKEVTVAAAGARVEKQGDLRIAARLRLKPDGEGAKALAGAEPLDFDPLAHLPNEPFVFAFGGVFPESFTELSIRLSSQLIESGAFPFGGMGDTEKLMRASMESMKGLRGMSMMLGAGSGDEPLYGRMMGVLHVKDSADYMTKYRKATDEVLKSLKKSENSMFRDMTIEETRVGDVKGLKVSMGIPIPPGMDEIPEFRKMMEQMMEKMYGKGGKILVFIAPAGEHDVVMSYTSAEPAVAMLRTIKQGQKGLSGDPQLETATAKLPAERLATMYWSPKGTFAFAKRMIAIFSAMGAGGAAPQFPEFPDAPAVGGAVSKGPAEVRFDLIVPAKTIDIGAEYIQKLMAM